MVFFLVSLERAIYKKIGKHCRRPFKIIIVKDIKSLKHFFCYIVHWKIEGLQKLQWGIFVYVNKT